MSFGTRVLTTLLAVVAVGTAVSPALAHAAAPHTTRAAQPHTTRAAQPHTTRTAQPSKTPSVTVDLPVPPGVDPAGVYVDGAPACAASRACVIAGSYAVADNVYRPLLEVTTGRADGSWRAVPLPLPGGADSAYLSDVRCPSTRECYAIGNYLPTGDDTGAGVGFAVTLSSGTVTHGTWSLVPLPGAFTVTALACPASRQCVATGTSPDGVGVLTFDGSSVRSAVVPAPTGTDAQGAGALSCAAGPFCSTDVVASDGDTGYVLIDDRGRFSFRALPGTTDAAGTQYTHVGATSVSCPARGFCVYADQAYFDNQARNSAIALLYSVYDRGTISTAPAPRPAGITGPAGNTRSSTPVWSISCASRVSCTGVGSSEYQDASGTSHQVGFVDAFRSGVFSSARVVSTDVVNTAEVGYPGPLVQPVTESCPAAGRCGIGVNQAVAPGPTGVVSLRADGADPITVPLAAPAGLPTGGTVVVDALTCRPSLTFCAGVGRAGSLSDGFARRVLTTVTAS